MNRRERRRAARSDRGGRDARAPYEELLSRALRLHQAGDLDRAAPLYRRALDSNPSDPAALHLYGLLHQHAGDHVRAIDLIGRAIDGRPEDPVMRNHMAQSLGALGRYEEAARHLERAVALRPDYAEAHNNLGNALDGLGRAEDAARHYEAALAINPGLAEAHNNLGIMLARQGHFERAIARYRRALTLKPGFADASKNLGSALAELGQLEDGVSAYRKALSLDAGHADSHALLASALAELGRTDEAIHQYREALSIDPAAPGARAGLVAALRNVRPDGYQPVLDQVLADCFAASGIRYDDLAAVTAQHLLRKHGIAAIGPDGSVAPLAGDVIGAVAGDNLFLNFLCKCVNADPAMERFLTALRRSLLLGRAEAPLPLLAALARQCMNNEHVFAADDKEEDRAAELAAAAGQMAVDPASSGYARALTLIVLYRALHELPWSEPLAGVALDDWPEPLRPIIEDGLLNRLEERRLAGALPAIGEIRDTTSRAVAGQYEANPYPRWLSAVEGAPEPAAQAMRRRFPHLTPPGFLDGPIEILVAGCGTGQHPIAGVARAYEDCRVLAVDLSRASLAYASRMAGRMGVDNIEFACADILGLAVLDRRFHVIECSGVLHHMADPVAGWRVLRDLLVPGGLMSIALYSERARRSVVAARERIAALGLSPTARDIRAFRRQVLGGTLDGEVRAITAWQDFYSLSGCRDLLFHVQEQRFTLPRIAEIMDELDLAFLGFDLADRSIRRRYRRRFPEDETMTDLAAWDWFEQEHPDTFANMYEFWCCRRDGA